VEVRDEDVIEALYGLFGRPLPFPAEPYRLWSLSEMLKFNAAGFFSDLDAVNWNTVLLPEDVSDSDYEEQYQDAVRNFQDVADHCAAIGMKDSAEEALRHKAYAEEHRDNPKGIHALSDVLFKSVGKKLEKRVFLWVRSDLTSMIDNEKSFGQVVFDAFPSARPDVKEAGNCLAGDCGTAAVFHLMRVAEVALRELARDRRVTFPKGNIDQKQWGEILNKLQGEIAALITKDAKSWPSEDVRQQQVRFYQEALIMFNAFNDVFRRHVAHAREDSIYDTPRAITVWNYTKRFMEWLAPRINETGLGDEYWTSA
jgi:hypothetical protein